MPGMSHFLLEVRSLMNDSQIYYVAPPYGPLEEDQLPKTLNFFFFFTNTHCSETPFE